MFGPWGKFTLKNIQWHPNNLGGEFPRFPNPNDTKISNVKLEPPNRFPKRQSCDKKLWFIQSSYFCHLIIVMWINCFIGPSSSHPHHDLPFSAQIMWTCASFSFEVSFASTCKCFFMGHCEGLFTRARVWRSLSFFQQFAIFHFPKRENLYQLLKTNTFLPAWHFLKIHLPFPPGGTLERNRFNPPPHPWASASIGASTSTWHGGKLRIFTHGSTPTTKTGGTIFWLAVSTPLKNISQNGNLPQIGLNMKNIWNHHLLHLVLVSTLAQVSKKHKILRAIAFENGPEKAGCNCKLQKSNWRASKIATSTLRRLLFWHLESTQYSTKSTKSN